MRSVFLLAILAIVAAAQSCTTHDAQTIEGNDIGDPINTDSKKTCCDLCQNDMSCLAAVFDGIQCQKKSVVGPTTESFISSVLIPPPPTPAPVTPAPLTPAPVTPAPLTLAPVTPAPPTPAPVTLAPASVSPTKSPAADDGTAIMIGVIVLGIVCMGFVFIIVQQRSRLRKQKEAIQTQFPGYGTEERSLSHLWAKKEVSSMASSGGLY